MSFDNWLIINLFKIYHSAFKIVQVLTIAETIQSFIFAPFKPKPFSNGTNFAPVE